MNEINFQEQQKLLDKIKHVQCELHKIQTKKAFENDLTNIQKRSNEITIQDVKSKLKTYYLNQLYIEQIITNGSAEKTKFRPKVIPSKLPTYDFSDNSIEDLAIQLSTVKYENEEKERARIEIIKFSVIPSLFNFFFEEEDMKRFIKFIKIVFENDKTMRQTYYQNYSSIIYYTPFFLNFCRSAFYPILRPYIYDKKRPFDENQFYEELYNSFQKNLRIFPSLLRKFIKMLDKINVPFTTHFYENFLDKLLSNPNRFIAIPEYYSFPQNFFEPMRRKLYELYEGGSNCIFRLTQLLRNKEIKMKKFDFNITSYIWTSFDLDIIAGKDEIDIINYDYKLIRKEVSEQDQSTIMGMIDFRLMEFRQLLKISDPLPEKLQIPAGSDLFTVLNTYLVNTGNFNHLLHRRKLLNKFRGYLKAKGIKECGNLEKLIIVHDEDADEMDMLLKQYNNISILSNLNKAAFDGISEYIMVISSIAKADMYTSEQIGEICQNPLKFIDELKQIGLAYKEREITIKKNYFTKRMFNLRFSDFIDKHKNLAIYDEIFYTFIKENKIKLIEDFVNATNLKKFKLLENLFLIEPIIEIISTAFEINGHPLEKFKLISHACEKGNKFDDDKDNKDNIFNISLIYANPKKFVSNLAFLNIFIHRTCVDLNWTFDLIYSIFSMFFKFYGKNMLVKKGDIPVNFNGIANLVPMERKVNVLLLTDIPEICSFRKIFVSQRSFITYEIVFQEFESEVQLQTVTYEIALIWMSEINKSKNCVKDKRFKNISKKIVIHDNNKPYGASVFGCDVIESSLNSYKHDIETICEDSL